MSAEPKLPRWTEPGSDAPAELAELLRAGRLPLGSAEQVAQLSHGLAERIGADLASPAANQVATATRGGLRLARWAAGAVAGAGSIAALWYFTARPPSEAPPSEPAPAPAQLEAPQLDPAPQLEAPQLEAPQLEAPQLEASAPSEPPAAREPAAGEPAEERAAQATPRARRTPGGSEVELLRRAQAALVAQPARALALTSEHQRRFREGVLAEEREALAIEALRRLGRLPEAQRRAEVFQRRYPNSVHASRLRGLNPPAPASGH